MSFFSKNTSNLSGGVIIDIGSGSVGVGLVQITPEEKPAKVLWSHREYILDNSKREEREQLREIQTALMNALLELGGAGLSSPDYTNSGVTISHIQVTLSAPWAHTATKTIRFTKDEPFVVSKHFIADLIKSSKQEDSESDNTIKQLGLVTISNTIAEIQLNEYVVANPVDTRANSLTLSLITSAVGDTMLEAIENSCGKIFPEIEIRYFSFIDVLHKTLQHLKPHTSEVCILDVTDQATEIGIVRDDVLRYCAFRPTGLHTLASKLSTELSFTKEESYSILKRPSEELATAYKSKEILIIDALFAAYEHELISLFNDTNDDLSIPESIFIHTDALTEDFFHKRITNAAHALSPTARTVHFVNENMLGGIVCSDSALGVCAYFLKESPQFKHNKNIV